MNMFNEWGVLLLVLTLNRYKEILTLNPMPSLLNLRVC